MNDLLGNTPSSKYGSMRAGDEDDLEAGGPATDQRMQEFNQQVDDIKRNMQQIQQKLKSLQDANEESKLVTRAPAMKALKERMETDINEVLKVAHSIKQKIERLDRANLENRKVQGCGEKTATDRTRMSITATVKKQLRDLMEKFQDLRSKFQSEYREVVERRYYTVTGKLPDRDTVDRLIETGDSESIFHKAIQEQGRRQLLDTMAEIQERHNAVRDIEKQLLELHQIFMDMAVLVESQGELIDNIEVQVGSALDHVASATVHLNDARTKQRNTRKWMCYGIILLLIIVIIIVLVVVKPWSIK